MSTKPGARRRSSSVTSALKQVPLNQQHTESKDVIKPLSGRPRPPKNSNSDLPDEYRSLGLKGDLRTGRWMLVPSSALLLLVIPAVLCLNQFFLIEFGLMGPLDFNPFSYLLFPQHRLANGKYTKGVGDFFFIAYYIIFWSFVRQTVTLYFLRPLGKRLGIPKSKMMRFLEQGYAVFYFTILGSAGIFVMSQLPTWWYKTEHFWLEYPHKEMTLALKTYYLMQAAYWCQQAILLVAKVEKPRKDFKELVAHHIVTLWLIGWSYGIYLTYIGVSIFVTMDISDIFLALAKCVNYVDESASVPFFAWFVGVWTYFRHYLNIRVLWSVYTQFDLIPAKERQHFRPLQDEWLAPWMKWQIFTPILLLQFINLFWYFLILRILVRALRGNLKDERSDDEGEDEAELETKDKVKVLKQGKAE
ncbi:sphingosine N-acyltransferase lag1 [Cryptotrichosporon argae]